MKSTKSRTIKKGGRYASKRHTPIHKSKSKSKSRSRSMSRSQTRSINIINPHNPNNIVRPRNNNQSERTG